MKTDCFTYSNIQIKFELAFLSIAYFPSNNATQKKPLIIIGKRKYQYIQTMIISNINLDYFIMTETLNGILISDALLYLSY